MKRIISILLATVMCLSISVSAAIVNDKDAYTFEVAFVDANGNKITTAEPGDKVSIALFVYNTANPATDVVIDANMKAAMFTYGISYDSALTPDKAGADEEELTPSVGTALLIDIEDYFVITGDVDITVTGATFNNKAAAVKVMDVTLPAEETTYDVWFYDNNSLADGDSGVAKLKLVPSQLEPDDGGTVATLTVAAKQETTPAVSGTTNGSNGVTTKDGTVRYDNAYEIKVTLTAAAGDAVGVEFVPGFMFDKVGEEEAWNKYAAETTEYSDVLGAGTTEFRAALIGVPVDVKDATFQMHARAFVKNSEGVKTYGDVVTGDFQYTIPK